MTLIWLALWWLASVPLNLGDISWRPRGRGIAVRTGCLVVAAILLLWVCRNGQSAVIVWVAFAVYVAAAAIWVRGQYAASLTAGWLWTPHWLFSLILTLLCAALFALWLDIGWLFIGGLVGTFFCLGYLSMGLRKPPATPTGGHFWWWVGALAVLSALTLIGVLLLGSETWFRLLVLAALLVPIPLAVLSGRAVTVIKSPAPPDAIGVEAWVRGHALRLGVAVGVALAGVGTAIAVSRVDGWWMWVVTALLMLVVLALVSSTYADIAIIIAVIALLGITQPQHAEDADVTLSAKNDQVLVALGDSYMSGEGAMVYHEGTDNGGVEENHCRRAPTAWAELAAQRYEFNGFYTVACSGARSYNVNDAPPDPPNGAKNPESQFPNAIGQQLADYRAAHEGLGFETKLAVVSLGGNDAGFSTIGAMCLAPGDCGALGDKLWIPKLAEVEYQLRATFDQISKTFDGVPVAVAGYPDPIYTRSEAETDPPADCDRVPLSRKDRDFIEKLLVGLNTAVKDAAVDAGFYYVREMPSALAKAQLQLCDPRNDNRSGLNMIGLQSVSGVAEDRFNPKNWYHNSLHRNERGHAAMLTAFKTWLDRHPKPLADIPGHPRGQALALADAADERTDGGVEVEDCQLYDVDESAQTCEDVGYNWIGSEVRPALFRDWWGLIYFVIGVGAWLLAVTFFAWRMRVVANDPA